MKRDAASMLRRVILRPYVKGKGPTFTLATWDTGEPYHGGPQWRISYRLTMSDPETKPNPWSRIVPETLFDASDFGCSPLHAIDSDACILGILGFLTLRIGDTDRDYFDDYTDRQREFANSHAEALACEAEFRFGKDGSK